MSETASAPVSTASIATAAPAPVLTASIATAAPAPVSTASIATATAATAATAAAVPSRVINPISPIRGNSLATGVGNIIRGINSTTIATANKTVTTAQQVTAQAVVGDAQEITRKVKFNSNPPKVRIFPRNNENNNGSINNSNDGSDEPEPEPKSDNNNDEENDEENDEPIKQKEIRIYNRSFLVETKVQDPLTEEQELLYKHLRLPELEGEEDEEWRHKVLQEVIDGCTADFTITLGPQCDTFRSYLEKLAQKVFDEDEPILWEGEEEQKEEEEDGKKKKKKKAAKKEKEEEKEVDITITIDLADLRSLLNL
jgi:hypothetical protein